MLLAMQVYAERNGKQREAGMQAQARIDERVRPVGQELDRAELLQIVSSLRAEVRTMADDVRDVLVENASLREQVERNAERRAGGGRYSEVARIREELDEMIRMHDRASARRAPRCRPAPEPERRASGSHSMLKTMMMCMMLAELA